MAGPTEDDVAAMQHKLAEVMGMLKHEVTDFEVEIWQNIMRRTEREKFFAFLKMYLLSPESRYGAPKPHDAAKALGFAVNPEVAYWLLDEAVRTFGPYQEPGISDPVLIQAIQIMGGWSHVNEIMPAQTDSFRVGQFKERLAAAMTVASNRVLIDGAQPEPLKALGNAAAPVYSSPMLSSRSAALIASPKERG